MRQRFAAGIVLQEIDRGRAADKLDVRGAPPSGLQAESFRVEARGLGQAGTSILMMKLAAATHPPIPVSSSLPANKPPRAAGLCGRSLTHQ
jgi:hypothetical protein